MRLARALGKSVVVLTVFAAGMLTGRATLLGAPPAAPGELVQVELTGPADHAPTPRRVQAEVAPQARAADVSTRVEPREIARRALEHTAYLKAGPVYGAGALLDEAGHVLTADHVVEGTDGMYATFHDDPRPNPVTVVARDKQLDLALLRLERVPEGRRPARIGSIVGASMGDEVFAMGAPRKMQFSLSRGIVSYVGRSFDGTLYVQTDLAANSGSSGGPVMNERGELIGISSFILKNSQGLAFAVPVDYAFRRFAEPLGTRDVDAFESWVAERRPRSEEPLKRHASK
jgi:S1-C subfamily serine protease